MLDGLQCNGGSWKSREKGQGEPVGGDGVIMCPALVINDTGDKMTRNNAQSSY